MVQSFLLCDLATNPDPAKLACIPCQKTIKKNQGRASYSSCKLAYYLKCLGSDFENNRLRNLCSTQGQPDPVASETNQDQPYDTLFTNVGEMASQRGLNTFTKTFGASVTRLTNLDYLSQLIPTYMLLHLLKLDSL